MLERPMKAYEGQGMTRVSSGIAALAQHSIA